MAADPIADAFRRWGYLQADLDPLGRLEPFHHEDLAGLKGQASDRWRSIYCGSIGAEFMHIPYANRCRWIAARMESEPPELDRRRILERLAGAELLERFLHARYVGTKRYSLEGSASVVPLLDAILDAAAAEETEVAIIGMSHRGRLAVVANIVGIPPASLFAGFEDVEPRSVLGGGDVKYHQGATGDYKTSSGATVHVHLVSNPSHLEAVDPVIMGRVRARQERLGPSGLRKVLAITLHGDAAFAGQGIAAETLNFADLPGFTVGGSIHIIVNNLIGFTTSPRALHSSRYASDVAKRMPIPIFHVNGQDPDAVVRAGKMALDYRATFGSDVVIDLIGFRRYGHSEVEDPTTTQPLLYRQIEAIPMLWQLYAQAAGFGDDITVPLQASIAGWLDEELAKGRAMTKQPVLRVLPKHWDLYTGGRYDPAFEVETAVDANRIREIASRIATLPMNLKAHPKVRKLLEQRLEMGMGKRPVEWGMAEALAFGTLLADGMLVRLSGQDSGRGTFNQRHAVLFDTESGEEYVPLRRVAVGQGRFDLYDTPLSEASCLGFEYGFSRDYPDALVCWEAQFGDFANGAQVIIDQFLCAGEDKWGLLCGLVVLLPHGYEGQGPEHSSARIERFLDLAGEDNIQVCQPSTGAQYFHLLRRQALRRWRKPLIVLTPKGLLRAPTVASPLEEFSAGRFRPVIGDDPTESGRRLLVCSGKIAHELRATRLKREDRATAIVTLEQLYPFPERELSDEIARHPASCEIVWVQEEPGNMGALRYVRPLLRRLAGDRHVTTIKRSASASPATGSAKAHAIEQEALLALAFAR